MKRRRNILFVLLDCDAFERHIFRNINAHQCITAADFIRLAGKRDHPECAAPARTGPARRSSVARAHEMR